MSRTLRRILFTIGSAVGVLVLVASAVLLFGDVDRYKHQLEAAASNALGMEFRSVARWARISSRASASPRRIAGS